MRFVVKITGLFRVVAEFVLGCEMSYCYNGPKDGLADKSRVKKMTLAMTESMEVLLILVVIVLPTICLCVLLWRLIPRDPEPEPGMLRKAYKEYLERKISTKDGTQNSPGFLLDMHVSNPLDIFAPITDEVCEATRRCVDAIFNGREQADEIQLPFLHIRMISVFEQKNSERKYKSEEDFNKDRERVTQIQAVCDEVRKRKTKLKVKCPGCGRSLKGATEAMIGDTAVCPKCKAEFTIENKSNKTKNKSEK